MQIAKVQKINITNFKGISTLSLDFSYQENNKILDNIVFYGVNGIGKSTVLEAIYICLIVSSIYYKKSDLIDIEKYLIDYLSLGDEWIYQKEDAFVLDIEFRDNSEIVNASLVYHKENGLTWSIKEDKKLSEYFQKSFTYLSSYRLLNPSSVHSAGDWKEINSFEKNDYTSTKQYLVNLITDKKLDAISDENKIILEKIQDSFKIFFLHKEFLEKLSRVSDMQDYRLMIKNEDGSIVDLDQLSSGEREIIAFFTYLCTKAINTSILIIDEPELHLHPKWQSIILYAIHKIFPSVQLFLATHSQEIHQSASQSELFELSK